jgi:protein-disulfide isomerase
VEFARHRQPQGPSAARARPGVTQAFGALLGLSGLAALLVASCAGAPAAGPETPGEADTSGADEASVGQPSGDQRQEGETANQESAPTPQAPRFDTSELPTQGPADAAVVVDVFSDFECPYCSLARRHTARLLEDFPSVRVRYRHFPLAGHPHAGMAAEASVEAYAQGGNEAFWCFHDQVFDHQSSLSRALLLELATRCRLDAGAMRQALTDHRHQPRVNQDRTAGEALGLQGTPTFSVNGTLVDGADYTDVEEAVDRAHPSW